MTALPVVPGPLAAECCAPSAGDDPSLPAERLAEVAKALSEPLRVRIVDVLRRSEEPVCQCELIALYGNSMQGMVPQYLESAMDSFSKNQAAFREAFGANIFGEIAKKNMAMFEEFTKATGAKRQEAPAGKSDSSEVDALRAWIASLKG